MSTDHKQQMELTVLKITEAMLILNALEHHPVEGAGVVTLSAETGIDANRLRQHLSRYPEYFSRVGDSSKYAINPASSKNKDPLGILEEIEKKQRRRTLTGFIALSIITLLVGFALGAMFVSMASALPLS